MFLIFFSKSGSKWSGGIKNEYHDPCQDSLDLINKNLTSPNYPKPYDPRTVCNWTLTTKRGNYVSLDFERIGVRDEKDYFHSGHFSYRSEPTFEMCSRVARGVTWVTMATPIFQILFYKFGQNFWTKVLFSLYALIMYINEL